MRLSSAGRITLALLCLWVLGCLQASASKPSQRILSLAPSLTEIVYAIGCGDQLVADTTYDDYPAAARRVPHVADLVQVDLERAALLSPSHALALHDQEHEAAALQTRLAIPVTYLPNRGLADLFLDITAVADVCRMPQAGEQLSASLRRQLAAIAAQTSRRPSHPKVLFLLDLPGFTVGRNSFLNDLIRLAGGVNVAASIQQPYPNVSAEWLLRVQPDVIIVSRGTPFGIDVRASQPWRSLRAVRMNHVYRPPSDDVVQRDGPRIVDGLRWLVSVIQR
ncbi:MAG: helical backbone metal receptor [Candidatus Eremiobacteraeota bacterium]|nr:helical backbone metal receptor [Candidatus Eremiobacteraeota bacterium]